MALGNDLVVYLFNGSSKQLKDVQIGDVIWACEEMRTGKRQRQWCSAYVIDIRPQVCSGLRCVTNRGSVVSSTNQRWMDRYGWWRVSEKYRTKQGFRWSAPPKTSAELNCQFIGEHVLIDIIEPVEEMEMRDIVTTTRTLIVDGFVAWGSE